MAFIFLRHLTNTVGAICITPSISMAANHLADKTRHKKHVYGFIFTLNTNSGRIYFDGIIIFDPIFFIEKRKIDSFCNRQINIQLSTDTSEQI
jgi:hypothetical protein